MYSLKIAFRNLRRNGIYSIINIVGLGISLAACILIMLWVQDELSFDRMHKKGNRTYRVLSQMEVGGQFWQVSPAPLPIALQTIMPEVVDYCRTAYYFNPGYLDYNNTKFYDTKVLPVDSSFFNIFDFRLVEGNSQQPFPDVYSMVVSKAKAKLFFGNENPIGKTIKAENGMTYHITGIMEDIPKNSTIQADALVRFDILGMVGREQVNLDENWGTFNYITYLVLTEHANAEDVNKRIGAMYLDIATRYGVDFQVSSRLQPLYDMHLYALTGEAAGMQSVYIFSGIALLILVIACINYVNLVTARASKRSKEVAVRKVMGADKPKLFAQQMVEMVILVLIALAVATILIYFAIPFYNQLSGKEMYFDFFSKSTLITYVVTIVATIGLAGIYPALMLISFKPTDAFQSVTAARKRGLFRKVLVVIQFCFSIGLIVANIVLSSQMHYIRTADLGYDKENTVLVRLRKAGYQSVKDRIEKIPGVIGITGSSYEHRGDPSFHAIKRKATDQSYHVNTYYIDTSFFRVMNISFVEGDGFKKGMSDTTLYTGIVFNEAAAKIVGEGKPILNELFDNFIASENYRVVGVIKDYNYESLHKEIKPLALFYVPNYLQYAYIKVLPINAERVLSEVEKIWKEYNPDYNFSYSFLDENFDNLYKSELQASRLLSIFAIIAVLISSLGLFGLITYTTEAKTKEIGIRKTLGASIGSIVSMLTKEFMLLVGIAMVIIIPLSYLLLNRVLQSYAYRISITWWMFVVAVLVVLVITILTVSGQALRAANANPVKAIKTE